LFVVFVSDGQNRPDKKRPFWSALSPFGLQRSVAESSCVLTVDGWAGSTIDGHGRPNPDVAMWPSAAGGKQGLQTLLD
jgi:hypothetical protein